MASAVINATSHPVVSAPGSGASVASNSAFSPLSKQMVKTTGGNKGFNSSGDMFSNAKNIIDYAYDLNRMNSENAYRQNQKFYDYQNEKNWSRYNTSFEKMLELENNSFQRRVADLKKAGINPLLAIRLGGAGVPNLSVPYGNISMPTLQTVGYDGGTLATVGANLYQTMINQLNNLAAIEAQKEIAKLYNETSVENTKTQTKVSSENANKSLVGSAIFPFSMLLKNNPVVGAGIGAMSAPSLVWNMLTPQAKANIVQNQYLNAKNSRYQR